MLGVVRTCNVGSGILCRHMKNGWKLARLKEGAVSQVGATSRAKV